MERIAKSHDHVSLNLSAVFALPVRIGSRGGGESYLSFDTVSLSEFCCQRLKRELLLLLLYYYYYSRDDTVLFAVSLNYLKSLLSMVLFGILVKAESGHLQHSVLYRLSADADGLCMQDSTVRVLRADVQS